MAITRPFLVVLAGAALAAPAAVGLLRREPALPAPASDRTRALTNEAARALQRARLSQDHADYEEAAALVREALAIAPDDESVLALLGAVLAGQHRFAEALEVARRAGARQPSTLTEGVLVDSLVELGRYEEAVAAAQAMMDRRPGPAAMARASYLRSLHGDREGAIELMRACVDASADRGEKAWSLVQLASELRSAGRVEEAARACAWALEVLPGYRPAELESAQARAGSGDVAGAEAALRAVLLRDPRDADAHLQLSQLLAAQDRAEESRRHLDEATLLERQEFAASSGDGDAHHLLECLLVRGDAAEEALALARREAERRRDVFTCDRLARALLGAGRVEEALEVSFEALRTGSDDPSLLFHAGAIAARVGDAETARERLRRAMSRPAALSPLAARSAGEILAELERG